MSGKQRTNGKVVPLMDVAQNGILRINHLRDRTSDAELRETYQSLLNTFLAMKAFAEGITDSEARKKVGVNAFWDHIKNEKDGVKVNMGAASQWSKEALNKRFPPGIINSKPTYHHQLHALAQAEKVGQLEDRMGKQEDLNAEQHLINNDVYSKLNELQPTELTLPSDKLPAKSDEESDSEVRGKL